MNTGQLEAFKVERHLRKVFKDGPLAGPQSPHSFKVPADLSFWPKSTKKNQGAN